MGTEQDGRLPIIPEENYYQRRLSGLYTIEGSLGKDASTLRLSETEDGPTNQSNANCDSTHLRSPECVTDSKTIGGDSSINDSMLPPTLETRKRRKYNTAWMDEATESEMFVSQSDTGTTQKSGFKRKFCAEDDEALESVPQEDDFQFTRPVSSPQLACERYVSLGTYSPVERPVELEKSSNNHKQPKRKALEPST
ncbi:hypothetical protein EYZ11_005918 [Aspergillus tanneri]|uniref:Uncharacterized protein n=1 Tax=Aspergillus tanneri TaxID=1220188 RepID=A0A4S3JHB4_9EURO|nr:hypothetical protein EYZ11_005918 [Aspergillus tanneri]